MADPLDLRAARALVLARTAPAERRERVPLAAAHRRVAAVDVCTDGPWPASDRSAMDGFALCAGEPGVAAGASLAVVGESLAGRPFARALGRGEAIRIMTGAVVPAGADTVVPVEQTSGFDGDLVTFTAAVPAGANIRRQGSERTAGECVIPRGRWLGAAEIGALAVLGHADVEVAARPRVAIVATGDEVVPVDEAPLPHQVRESNSWALQAQVDACGGEAERLGIAPDEPVGLRSMLERALATADVVLTIGGISKGSHDLVHPTLAELGVETVFHGVRLKPGKPTYFGVCERDGRRRYVFGLPGNPASTFTVFDLLVRPMLVRWLGGEAGDWGARAKLGDTGWKANWREQAVPARLLPGAGGELELVLAKPSPSGDPFSLLEADCYALVPPETARDAVTSVPVVGSATGMRLP